MTRTHTLTAAAAVAVTALLGVAGLGALVRPAAAAVAPLSGAGAAAWSRMAVAPRPLSRAVLDTGDDLATPAVRQSWWQKNIERPVRNLGRAIRKGATDVVESVAKVVREAGREVRRSVAKASAAVRRAGVDVAKFVRERGREIRRATVKIHTAVREATEALECVLNPRKCRLRNRALAARRDASEAEAAAAALVVAEDDAVASVKELTAGVNTEKETLKNDAISLGAVAASLRAVEASLPKPLSATSVMLLKRFSKPSAMSLADGEAALVAVRPFIVEVQDVDKKLAAAAKAAPTSTVLAEASKDASLLLVGLLISEGKVVEQVHALTALIETVNSLVRN